MTFTALLMPLLTSVFLPKDRDDAAFVPSLRDVGWSAYLRLAVFVVLVNTFSYFLVEAFTFSAWKTTLLSAFLSTLFTLLFVVALEYVRVKGK